MQIDDQMLVGCSDQIASKGGTKTNGIILNIPDSLNGQASKALKPGDAQVTPRSKMRASDVNLMTERGEDEEEGSSKHAMAAAIGNHEMTLNQISPLPAQLMEHD